MNNKVLIAAGRFPKEGISKTRLALDIGDRAAVDFYRQCAQHVLNEAAKLTLDIKSYFLYADSQDWLAVSKWLKGTGVRRLPPTNVDIEQNIADAFRRLLVRERTKGICVATDVPDLNSRLLREAFDALDNCNVVIGRDHKDGVYLFGIQRRQKKLLPDFFNSERDRDIPAFDFAMRIIKEKGLSCYQLPELLDVDTGEDLKRWQRHNLRVV